MNNMIFGRRVWITVGILALTMLVLAACVAVQAQPDVGATAQEEDMEAVINHIWTEYSEANMVGDSERWIELWDDNGVKLSPGAVPVIGKEAIYERKVAGNERNASSDIKMEIINEEFEVAGDWAWCRGRYTYEKTPEGGDTSFFEGKYMTILHKQADGSWKIYRDISNSNGP